LHQFRLLRWGRQEDSQILGVIFLEECQSRERSLIPCVFTVGKDIQGTVLQHQAVLYMPRGAYVEGLPALRPRLLLLRGSRALSKRLPP